MGGTEAEINALLDQVKLRGVGEMLWASVLRVEQPNWSENQQTTPTRIAVVAMATVPTAESPDTPSQGPAHMQMANGLRLFAVREELVASAVPPGKGSRRAPGTQPLMLGGTPYVNRREADVFVWTGESIAQVLGDGVPNNWTFLVGYFNPRLAPQARGTLLKVRVDALSGELLTGDLDRPLIYRSPDRMAVRLSWLEKGVAAVTHAYQLDDNGAVTAGYQVVGPGAEPVRLRMRITGATHGVTGLPEQVAVLSTDRALRNVYLLLPEGPAAADPHDVTISDEWVLLYRKKPDVRPGQRLLRVSVPGRALIDLTKVRSYYPLLAHDVPALAGAREDLLLPLRATDHVQDLSGASPTWLFGLSYDPMMSGAYMSALINKVYRPEQNIESDTEALSGQSLTEVLADYRRGADTAGGARVGFLARGRRPGTPMGCTPSGLSWIGRAGSWCRGGRARVAERIRAARADADRERSPGRCRVAVCGQALEQSV